MPETIVRSTRYNLHRPPKGIDKILRTLGRAAQRSSFVPDRNHFRGVLKGSTKACQLRPEADDVTRFLLNLSVVIEGDRGLYIDRQRIAQVSAFYEGRAALPDSMPVERRLRELASQKPVPSEVIHEETSEYEAASVPGAAAPLRSLPMEEQKKRIKAAIVALRLRFER